MSTVQDTSTVASTGSSASSSQKTAKVDEAQDRFLKLLVTQMKNQDPLNPLDNAQVTSQLAQISTVSGIEKLTKTMETMASSYTANQALQAASMIGHQVVVPGTKLNLQQGQAGFGIELSGAADNVQVTISDAAGKTVQSMDLGAQKAGTLSLTWDGVTDSGAKAVEGQYDIKVTAKRGSEKVEANTLSLGVVDSVSNGSQGVKLNLGVMGSASLADIKQIL